jgi:starch-binding outer membrane protein, SusD/RagB family
MNPILSNAAGRPSGGGTRRWRLRAGAVLAAVALMVPIACKDSVVPNFQSPQPDPLSQPGIQLRVLGVIAGTRGPGGINSDVGDFVLAMSSMGRDGGVFTTTDSRFITEWMGMGTAIPNSDFYGTVVWDDLLRVAKNAQGVINDLPSAKPPYSASDASIITGIMQTMKAYNFMVPLESRDTGGIALAGIDLPASQLAPLLCAKDAWAGIVAILDSGEVALDAATPGPLPVTLPNGFAAVNGAGPSGTAGSFGAFNRALRAKAGLEYAYAVARSSSGTAPTPATPGTLNAALLTSADSAAHASFLFNPGAIAVQTTATAYSDPLAVYHNFSGTSGDAPNPMQGTLTTLYVLDSAVAEFGTDPRAGKLIPNPNGAPNSLAGPTADAAASLAMTIGTYQSPNDPVPIVRNEELVLIDAAIQLGLGNTAQAVILVNNVRAAAGAAPVAPAGYPAVRDQILHEFRLSNLLEPGEDRTIMIRNYGVVMQNLTTWGTGDTHASVLPIPIGENSARGGNITPTCP